MRKCSASAIFGNLSAVGVVMALTAAAGCRWSEEPVNMPVAAAQPESSAEPAERGKKAVDPPVKAAAAGDPESLPPTGVATEPAETSGYIVDRRHAPEEDLDQEKSPTHVDHAGHDHAQAEHDHPIADRGREEDGEDSEEGSSFEITPEDEARIEAGLKADRDALAQDIVDMGLPLVDNLARMKKLAPNYPVWLDIANKRVVMVGRVCKREVPLEMFACLRGTKEHESVVSVPTKAFFVHAALLAIGAKANHPVRFDPKYEPASGSEIEITLIWEDSRGKRRQARAQDWVRDVSAIYRFLDGVAANRVDDELDPADMVDYWEPLRHPWVFGGSYFWTDEFSKKQHYMAEDGDFICVSNFASAMLDLPIPSSDGNAALAYTGYAERIPPRGTPVTLILQPKPAEAKQDGESE